MPDDRCSPLIRCQAVIFEFYQTPVTLDFITSSGDLYRNRPNIYYAEAITAPICSM